MGFEELHPDVVQFIERQIDTVPHIEALVLLWENREHRWRLEDIASRLYISTDAAQLILTDLARRKLVQRQQGGNDASYSYNDGRDQREVMEKVAMAYRRQLLKVTALIHSKPPVAVRDFASAFRLKD